MKKDIIGRICIGRALRHFRRKAAIDQWEVADVVGVNQSAYSKYETGATPIPAFVLLMTAERLEVDPDVVMSSAKILYGAATAPDAGDWIQSPKILAQWCDEILKDWEADKDGVQQGA